MPLLPGSLKSQRRRDIMAGVAALSPSQFVPSVARDGLKADPVKIVRLGVFFRNDNETLDPTASAELAR